MLLTLLVPRRAEAYPWMIRHGYTTCGSCHVDPSGGGNLTAFGRSQGDYVMRTRFESGEDTKLGGFLFGAVELPEPVLLQADFRALGYTSKVGDSKFSDFRRVHMQSDLRLAVAAESGLRVGLSGGYLRRGAEGTWLTRSKDTDNEGNVISREHWAGYAFGESKQMLVRGGRMNLPFGVRDVQHTLLVRKATESDINEAQQHGVAFAYSSGEIRGEIMGIAGNFQVAPDRFRDRGYAGYVEYAVAPKLGVGASSMMLRSETKNTRMAHGLFGRYSPLKPLVLLLESNVTAALPEKGDTKLGVASYLQADVEPVQGLHFIATGEQLTGLGDKGTTTLGGWGSVLWFFAPHADIRIDGVVMKTTDSDAIKTLLGQLHFYL